MNFLLDTNVVSEWVKPRPDRNVISWLAETDEDRVYLSVISIAEIRWGVELMPRGHRSERLMRWLSEELPARFDARLLPIDWQIAEAWGVVMARGRKAGRTVGTMDAFVAAIAETHRLTLVTRNVKDFQQLGIALLNPWQPRP